MLVNITMLKLGKKGEGGGDKKKGKKYISVQKFPFSRKKR